MMMSSENYTHPQANLFSTKTEVSDQFHIADVIDTCVKTSISRTLMMFDTTKRIVIKSFLLTVAVERSYYLLFTKGSIADISDYIFNKQDTTIRDFVLSLHDQFVFILHAYGFSMEELAKFVLEVVKDRPYLEYNQIDERIKASINVSLDTDVLMANSWFLPIYLSIQYVLDMLVEDNKDEPIF